MKKYLVLLLSIVFLSNGCGIKMAGQQSEAQKETVDYENSADMNPYYTEDGKHKEYYPPDSSFTEEDTRFYIDGNACIVDNYILAKVAMVGEIMLVGVGPNCYDPDRYDAMVAIVPSDIEIEDYNNLQVHSLVRIYYEFPDGFVPDDYLDYLDYATYITAD